MSLPAQPNESLIDGLAVLQALTVAEGPVGVREVARRLGLEPTRANRLLKTLAHLGLARQGGDRRYAIGPAVHVLAAQTLFASGLFQRAVGPLGRLHDLGHVVALGVLWRAQVCYLYHAEPGMDAADAIGRIQLAPAPVSGIGVALLATIPDDEVRRLYPEAPPPRHRSVDALIERLRAVRHAGFALVDVRDRPRIRSVGVAVGDPPYAAIALSGRFGDHDVPRLVRRITDAAGAFEPHANPAAPPRTPPSSDD